MPNINLLRWTPNAWNPSANPVLELQIHLVRRQFEQYPVHLRGGVQPAQQSAAAQLRLFLTDGSHAASRHRDECSLRLMSSVWRLYAAAKWRLYAAQQVVRLKDQQQLSWHRVQDRCDLRQIVRRRRLDYLRLTQPAQFHYTRPGNEMLAILQIQYKKVQKRQWKEGRWSVQCTVPRCIYCHNHKVNCTRDNAKYTWVWKWFEISELATNLTKTSQTFYMYNGSRVVLQSNFKWLIINRNNKKLSNKSQIIISSSPWYKTDTHLYTV